MLSTKRLPGITDEAQYIYFIRFASSALLLHVSFDFSNKSDEGKFTIIGDLAGWGLANMDIQGYLAVLDILQVKEILNSLFCVYIPCHIEMLIHSHIRMV